MLALKKNLNRYIFCNDKRKKKSKFGIYMCTVVNSIDYHRMSKICRTTAENCITLAYM